MNQNKTAFILALILSGMIMVSFIPAMLESKELTLIDHINSVRSKPLKEDKLLNEIALNRCKAMQEWTHEGWQPYANEIMYQYGRYGITQRYRIAGENLALANPGKVPTNKEWFDALQASVTHKANNESLEYQKVGSAKCKNKVGNVTVLLFAGN